MHTLESTYGSRTKIVWMYVAIVAADIAVFLYLISRFHTAGYGSVMVFFSLIPAFSFAFRFDRAVAAGDGTVILEAPWRRDRVNLREGFILKQLRLGKRALVLEAGGRSYRLSGLGTLDEVDHWLKETQVAV